MRRRRRIVGVVVLCSSGQGVRGFVVRGGAPTVRRGSVIRRAANDNGKNNNGFAAGPYGFHGLPVEKPIAFQGEFGAYSEEAAYQHFGSSITTLPCKSFQDVFNAVDAGEAAYGMLPMENSNAGSINKSYDLLMEYDLRVHGETTLRVKHSLLALPNDDGSPVIVDRVRSHPQALAQCEKYLTAQGLAIEAGSDTAGSAREIAQNKLHGVGAICSKLAAERYGLDVLATGIEDNKFNFTRFFCLGKGVNPNPIATAKTSIIFAVSDKPGSLVAALEEFGRRTVNIIKLESRPRRRTISPGFNYIFYLDFQGHHADPPCAAALMRLLESCAFVKLLGSYEAAPQPRDLFNAEAAIETPTLDPALMQI
ncbi:hypothetical protein CTAYLR_003916 [Chrysophaeum taylorii]|uniref:Prephenate dehydratase n=1 Tax=Chrysophaeum taylorii TaxID=2483200 RepID=A0AAD7U9Y6_9STRA|nr:hypothetical protein CTAYLR_003916 [Chrysophaeum taylorii]